MGKIRMFKDQEDYVKNLTDDEITNIIGTKGSGKTTESLKYINDDDYIVINCDRLLELPCDEKEDKELAVIRELLKEKYGSIKEGENFVDCYNDIVDYIKNNNKKGLIEGNIIQDINPELLKGKIIVKRTAKFNSFKRAVKRDYKNEYFMQLEKEQHKHLYKVTRFYKITKRRKSVFNQAKEIDGIIKKLERK